MSLHSRSSSEVEITPLSDIIPVCFQVLKDFDFDDVKDSLHRIFNDTEFDYIEKAKGQSQVFHLIWVLQTKSNEHITRFLDSISDVYRWIVDRINREANEPSEDAINYLEKLKSIQGDFQNHTDYNVHRTKLFLNLRSALRKLDPKKGYNSVVLLGGLGSGKKWLSIDVCSDFGVLKSMNFNIFWIDCSNCTSRLNDYEALKMLMIKLNPQHEFDVDYSNENFYRLKEQIKMSMKSKENNDCLLVLANVQNAKCLDAFSLGCKRLIITRNKKVSESLSPKLNIHLTLDHGLTIKEFNLLLDKYIQNRYDWRKYSGDMANDIYHRSIGDPYMLSIVARNIREKKSNWIEWMNNVNNFQIPDEKFQRDIEKSLYILTPQQLELYATLAVFPYCAQIPVKLLAYLWNKPLYEAEEIIRKLHINSFVQKQILEDHDTIVCFVKYVYSSYMKNCNKMQRLINPQELHSKIIEYYKIENLLDCRMDVALDFDSHDGYIFRWIAYHLYYGDLKDLFPKLYKDFGFLCQKMRAVGLNNTIADLRRYDAEISWGDRKYSFKKMKVFLAKMEEKIIHFPDCCLLQYALLSEDFIGEMALQQIEKFPRRLWFTEKGRNHQWRYSFSLPQTAKLVHILERDLCVISLSNNTTILEDLSLDSRCSRQLLMNGDIKTIYIFDDTNHVLTLDRYGTLNLWNIASEKRRMIQQRSNLKGNCNPAITCESNRLSNKQRINDFINSSAKIKAFYMLDDHSITTLMVAMDNGMLYFYDWNNKNNVFKHNSSFIPHPTHIKNIHSICIIKTHYMIIFYNDRGNVDTIFLKRSNTEQETIKFNWPENADQLVYRQVYGDIALLVFNHVVVRLTLTFHRGFDGNLEILYNSPHCRINCAKLLLENQYLMIGTEKGLIIFDIANGSETLHSSVSENISSVDNYDLDDDEFKSMIVCGCSNKNIAYIFGLRLASDQTLVWEHSSPAHQVEELAHLKNTRFLGQTLFAVSEENDTLYAVDSKNRIHQICCADTKNWYIMPPLDINEKVIGINSFKNSVIVAYENGDIYDLHEQRLIFRASEVVQNDFFVKNFNDQILVTSSAREKTYLKQITSDGGTTIPILTKYCTMIMENFMLLVNNYGATVITDCDRNFDSSLLINPQGQLDACDLKDNALFLGFANYTVQIYTLEKSSKGFIRCQKRAVITSISNDLNISCLRASNNAKLLALGLKTYVKDGLRSCGEIEIYKLNEDFKPQLIQCLKSHVRPINDLMFLPQNEVLISVAEQICFWNLNYVLNNPLDVSSKKRHSSRFTSQKSAEEVDHQTQNRELFLSSHECVSKDVNSIDNSHSSSSSSGNNNNSSMHQSICSVEELNDDSVFNGKHDECFWSSLTGASDKPELLSCLKLDGNEAKQIFANKNFTQFYTIDDEGVYYNLEPIKPKLTANTPGYLDVLDSSSSSVNLDYLEVHRLSIASSTMSGTDVVDIANT